MPATLTTPEGRLDVGPDDDVETVLEVVRAWVEANVPAAWLEAGRRGGPAAVREVRPRKDYEAWYPVFGRSGLVAPTWEVPYGGLGLSGPVTRRIDEELRPYNLGRLNPLGLNNAAAAILSYGSEEQKLRFLPPIVRNEERWCQLFSEPGAGSDLASLATRAERDGDEWIVHGQKVWTTWAHLSDLAILLARTDPDKPKRQGLTYFLIDLHQPGVEVRPLRHMGGEVEFNEVFLDGARIPDFQRLGEVGNGWKVAGATLAGERQMVSGSGSGGTGRIGGGGADRLIRLAKRLSAEGKPGGWDDPVKRDLILALWCEERIGSWTSQRVRAQARAGRAPGPESSIGKVYSTDLNKRMQTAAADLLGPAATGWEGPAATGGDPEIWAESLPYEVKGMFRSRANTIEGGTSEVNRNVLGERILGLPREPDPWNDKPWSEVPRS